MRHKIIIENGRIEVFCGDIFIAEADERSNFSAKCPCGIDLSSIGKKNKQILIEGMLQNINNLAVFEGGDA